MRMNFVSTAFAVVVLVQSAMTRAAAAPSTPDAEARPDLLGKLVGTWVLRGELAGKQTVHDVKATWVLNDQYVRLDEVSRERDDHGRPAYQASIYVGWEPKSHTYTCIWLDSTAVATGDGNCSAKPTANQIPFLFRDKAGTVNFANTFVYVPETDRWEWRLDEVAKDKTTPFGWVVLTRK